MAEAAEARTEQQIKVRRSRLPGIVDEEGREGPGSLPSSLILDNGRGVRYPPDERGRRRAHGPARTNRTCTLTWTARSLSSETSPRAAEPNPERHATTGFLSCSASSHYLASQLSI